MELEADDPRQGRVWKFDIFTEQLDDGTWRAWYPSAGWVVTAASEDEARRSANEEGMRRRQDPDEVERKIALMRRHLVEPVQGVSIYDHSVLDSAWGSDNPAQAVRDIIAGLGPESPRQC
jgi:hypothetical protein